MVMPQLKTKVYSLGQMAICEGCCCGRTDKGHPAIPRDELKAAWKKEQLNRTVQLTISGCLGPCDLANVVMLLSPTETIWLGDLETSDYATLLDWVRACKLTEQILPLPESLELHRFDRFPGRTLPDCQASSDSTPETNT